MINSQKVLYQYSEFLWESNSKFRFANLCFQVSMCMVFVIQGIINVHLLAQNISILIYPQKNCKILQIFVMFFDTLILIP